MKVYKVIIKLQKPDLTSYQISVGPFITKGEADAAYKREIYISEARLGRREIIDYRIAIIEEISNDSSEVLEGRSQSY